MVLLLSFLYTPAHSTMVLYSPTIDRFASDDWTVVRAMKAFWLPPHTVSEMCCRWICDIPRLLQGKNLFVSIDDQDIRPAEIVKVHFGAFVNLSLTSQVGR